MSRLDSVGIAKQASLGTKQTTMEYFVDVESADVSFNSERMQIETTTGNRFPTGIDNGTYFYELELKSAARAASFPRVLSTFFGAPTTSATAFAGAKSHLFDPAAAGKAPVPHSILINRTDPVNGAVTDLLYDTIGNELTISVEPNGWISYEASLAAISNDDARPEPTVTLDTSRRFSFDEATAFISINGGAETAIKLSSWEFSYSNNVDTEQVVLGQRNLYTIFEGNADASFKFKPVDSSAVTLLSHYRRALLADPDSVKLRLTATGTLIGSGVSYKFEVIAYKLEYLDAPANISAGERLNMIDVTARAAYDTGTSKFVTVEVINEVTSY